MLFIGLNTTTWIYPGAASILTVFAIEDHGSISGSAIAGVVKA